MEIDRPAPKRWVGPALAALLLLSFALRAWDAGQGLHAGRYFDERYTFRNVSLILRQGNWKPGQAYYLSLSYLPQTAVLAASQALHRATGIDALSIYGRTSDRYSTTAYRLARLCNVTYGVLSLWMIFLIGRRIFSPEAGLLAAAILAAFPRHLLSSTQFKPDILVLLLTLVVFYWTLGAVLRPTLGRYLRVGLGIGLAVSTKYTGIGAAIPIAGAALIQGWRDRRRWGWLALAGLTAAAVFVVLNPYLGIVFEFIPKLLTNYSGIGRQRGSDHGEVMAQQVRFLIEHHGAAIAALAAAGLLGWLWRIARPDSGEPWDRERRIGAALALGHVLGYSVFHASATTLFRGQNYLLVVPFSSLAAAWAMVELWRALARRASPLRAVPVAAALWLVPAALLAWQQSRQVYERVVPTSWQSAREVLVDELSPLGLGLRQVVYESQGGTLRLARNADRAIATPVDDLPKVDAGELDRADAEVFLRSRFDGPQAEAYRAREARLRGGRVRVVSDEPFRSRGGSVVLLLHPWSAAAAPEILPVGRPPQGRHLGARLPTGPVSAMGEVVSVVLWLPREDPVPEALRIDPGGKRIPLHETGRRGKRRRLVTPRFELTGGQEQRLRFPAPPDGRLRAYRLELHRWRRP